MVLLQLHCLLMLNYQIPSVINKSITQNPSIHGVISLIVIYTCILLNKMFKKIIDMFIMIQFLLFEKNNKFHPLGNCPYICKQTWII
uniref:Uncharacterized protein n=1 Tax=Lepeophtheirus salmonis TaxID=72036 RepID=A0A0K2TGK6_LEPSM